MRHTIPFAALMLLPLLGCSPHREEGVIQAPPVPVSVDATQIEASTPTAPPAEQVASVQTAANSAVKLSGTFEPVQCKPGEKTQIVFSLKVGDGWHIYAMKGGAGPSQPTRIKLELPAWIKEEGDWSAPDAQVNLSNFGPEMIHSGEVSFTRNLIISPDAPAGLHHVPCAITLQACNASRCLPPETFSLSLPLTVLTE